MAHESEGNGLMANIPDSVWNIRDGASDIGEHPSFEELADAIAKVTFAARNMAARHVLDDQLWAYWNSGRMIVAYEQGGRGRAEYGDSTPTKLSRRLTSAVGQGFSRANCAAR